MSIKNNYYKLDFSHNAKYTIICGGQGIGKTHAAFSYIWEQSIKHKVPFAYCRRSDVECKLISSSHLNKFAAAANMFVRNEHRNHLIKDAATNEILGVTSSIKNGARGTDARVGNILFDECVPVSQFYFSAEFKQFMMTCNTLGRDVLKRVFITFNKFWLHNPYLFNFDVYNDKDTSIYNNNGKAERVVLFNLYSQNPPDYIGRRKTERMFLIASAAIKNTYLNVYEDGAEIYVECGPPNKRTIGLTAPYNGRILSPSNLPTELTKLQNHFKTLGVYRCIFADWKAATFLGYLAYSLYNLRLSYLDEHTD